MKDFIKTEILKTWRHWRLPAVPLHLVGVLVCGGLLVANVFTRAAIARYGMNEKPRVHLIQDMDNQPKGAPQAEFTGGTYAQLAPAGTVAMGSSLVHADISLQGQDDLFHFGYEIDANTGMPTEDVEGNRIYLEGFPMDVDVNLIHRGERLFDIHCATCHGTNGHGFGPTTLRATDLRDAGLTGTGWSAVADLTGVTVTGHANGKILEIIREGAGNMGSMGSKLSPEESWAIIAYVRVLQDIQQTASAE